MFEPTLWPKHNDMTHTTHTDAASAAVAIISTNMLQQIIALQEMINAREPQQRFPTMQEAGLLTKMITALEKLKRVLAPPKQPAQPRKKSQSKAGDELNALTQWFLNETDMAATRHEVEAEQPSPASSACLEVLPTPDPKESSSAINADKAGFPILEHEFEAYKFLFDDTRGDRSRTTVVKGVAYSTNWLQYNLYQYSLPHNERRFFYEEARYYREIAHENVAWLIQKYLRHQQRA